MNTISVTEYQELLRTKAGRRTPRGRRRTSEEEELQRDCAAWVALNTRRYPILEWMIHVPNGGKRPRGEAGKLKSLGVKKGVVDFLLPFGNGGWRGLDIELKSATGRVTKEQKRWIERADEDRHYTAVCRSLDAFVDAVQVFLRG